MGEQCLQARTKQSLLFLRFVIATGKESSFS